MPINYEIVGLKPELQKFSASVEAVSMDTVKRKTLKRIAQEMAEMVRLAIVAEPDIQSPAMNGPHERGEGPSLSAPAAWRVKQTGTDRWSVFPHPKVRQRAVVLNYGYPGRIYPSGDAPLSFTVNGTPVFAESVKGPDATGYWQSALRQIETSGRIKEIAEDELDKEFERKI